MFTVQIRWINTVIGALVRRESREYRTIDECRDVVRNAFHKAKTSPTMALVTITVIAPDSSLVAEWTAKDGWYKTNREAAA